MKLTRIAGLCLALVVGLATASWAQQESIYTQYMFNRLVINPAYAGTVNGISLTAMYRHQWTGFQGQPQTFTFSGHAPIANNTMGVGAYVINDQIGVTGQTAFGVNYAYRIKINNSYLSLGVQASGIQKRLNGADLIVENPDPSIPSNNASSFLPDFGAGIFFNNGKFYAGASVAHLAPLKYSLTNGGQAQLARHYFFTAGYDISLGDKVVLTPSAFVRSTDNKWQFDVNVNAMFLDRFWVGGVYRHQDAAAIIAGFYPIKDQLRISYSYDISTNGLSSYQNGTHEIMVSYLIPTDAKEKYISPRYFN